MTKNILGTTFVAYKRKTEKIFFALTIISLICLATNIVFVFFATENTKLLFIAINILTDIVVFSLDYGVCMLILKDRLLFSRLYHKKEEFGQTVAGTILSKQGNERIEKIDCKRIILLENGRERVLYAPVCRMTDELTESETAIFTTVNNIIAEVVYE